MADEKELAVAENSEVKETKKEDKKKKSDKKPGFGSKIKKFFKDNKSELKKIVWYSKDQLVKSSILVIVSLVVVSAVVSLLDIGLNRLIMWIGGLV